jgi:hypothetical protein
MPSSEGTEIEPPSTEEAVMLKSGLSVGEVLLAAVKPREVEQLELTFHQVALCASLWRSRMS